MIAEWTKVEVKKKLNHITWLSIKKDVHKHIQRVYQSGGKT